MASSTSYSSSRAAPPPPLLPTPAFASALAEMTVHASPPPSLTQRFGALQAGAAERGASRASSLSREASREREVDRSSVPPEGFESGGNDALQTFIQHLLSPKYADPSPHLMAIGYELEALLSIYGDSSLKLCLSSRPPSLASSPPSPTLSASSSSRSRSSQDWSEAVFDDMVMSPGERIRYEVTIPAWEEGEVEVEDGGEAPKMRVLISLPPTYPNSSPPQLQLMGRYIGAFAIDSGLFGDVTRTYITSSGVPFTPGDVCVFEGLTHTQSLVRKWYTSQLADLSARQAARDELAHHSDPLDDPNDITPTLIDPHPGKPPLSSAESYGFPSSSRPSPQRATFSYSRPSPSISRSTPADTTPLALTRAEQGMQTTGLVITSSDPIVDRRSTFIGHAVQVTDEREVPLVIHELLGDKKIAKATHPAIFAYRIAKDVGGAAGKIYAMDCDDDGESAAGARLAHLLEILELENVLVVVSRWYGGTLLGADRFKHINQAARDALDKAGLLVERSGGEKDKGKGGRRR